MWQAMAVGAALGIAIGAVAHAQDVRINELLYDPAGVDGGAEFVELYNSGAQTVSLGGWRLEAGNGAAPGDWREQWRGGGDESIAAGGFYLIAGQRVPAADAVVDLVLQNGPDAARLCTPGGIADCVGWGELAHAEYYTGAPAPDVPGGWALARVPDGDHQGSNALDFQARRLPTPGAPNVPPQGLAITRVAHDPPLIDPGGAGRFCIEVSNLGLAAVDPTTLTWEITAHGLTAEAAGMPGGQLAPDAAGEWCWTLLAGAGSRAAAIEYALWLGPDSLAGGSAGVCLGRGPVLIAELLFDPAGDGGEWVELLSVADTLLDLSGWVLGDAAGRETVLGDGPEILAPGQRRLVAQNSDGLLAAWPEVSPGDLAGRAGAWPSLNNNVDPKRGYADEIRLANSGGEIIDYVRYSPGSLAGRGVSLERWISAGRLVDPLALIPCSAPGGATPGEAPRGIPGEEEGAIRWLCPEPNPFSPGQAGEERFCRIALPRRAAAGARVTADIFSMAGRRVTTLAAGAEAGGPLVLVWDGRGGDGRALPTGIYILRVAVGSAAVRRALTLVRG